MELLPFPILERSGEVRGEGNANQLFICSDHICLKCLFIKGPQGRSCRGDKGSNAVEGLMADISF